MLTLLLSILALGPTGEAVARPDAPLAVRKPAIARPTWVRRPRPEEIRAAYPKAARRAGVAGRVTLSCLVTAEGRLSPCEVVAETPGGQGFAKAALSLSSRFQMRPTLEDGSPVAGGTVRLPILFDPEW